MDAGVDVGFGDCKAVYPSANGLGYLKFPSAVAHAENRPRYLDDLAGDKAYKYEGSRYTIGESAAPYAMSTQNYEFLKRYSALLIFRTIEIIREQTSEDVSQIGVGLSLNFYEKGRVELRPLIEEIRVNGQEIRLMPVFCPQCYGAFCDYRLNNEGLIRPLTAQDMLVVDVGFNTVDICAITKGKISPRGSLALARRGVCIIAERLRNDLQELEICLTAQEAAEAIRTRHCLAYGSYVDCTKSIDAASQIYSEWLLNEIASRWQDHIQRSAKIILAGGGAHLIREHFFRKYQDLVLIPDRPEFANARGYLKLVRFQRLRKERAL